MNKEIEINSYVFVNKHGLSPIPKTITVEDQRYSFVDAGLRYLIKRGQHLISLFDMTDGQSVYRLRKENDQWTLVSIKNLAS